MSVLKTVDIAIATSDCIRAWINVCISNLDSGFGCLLHPPSKFFDSKWFIMADCHPILFLRMMDKVKAGAKLIVVDPRRSATADKATLFMQIKPGTDLTLLTSPAFLKWIPTLPATAPPPNKRLVLVVYWPNYLRAPGCPVAAQ